MTPDLQALHDLAEAARNASEALQRMADALEALPVTGADSVVEPAWVEADAERRRNLKPMDLETFKIICQIFPPLKAQLLRDSP